MYQGQCYEGYIRSVILGLLYQGQCYDRPAYVEEHAIRAIESTSLKIHKHRGERLLS